MKPKQQSVETEANAHNEHWLHRIGAIVSLACAVHCILTPVLVAALPIAGLKVLESETAETVLLGFILLITIPSMVWGYLKHRNVPIFFGFVLSLAGLITSFFVGEQVSWAFYLSIVSAIAIGILQLLSIRRYHPHCDGEC